MDDTNYTDEEIDTVSVAIICLSNVIGGEIFALLASATLQKAIDNGKWAQAAKTMREALVQAQAVRVERGLCSEEEMTHWAKHAKQMVEVLGAE